MDRILSTAMTAAFVVSCASACATTTTQMGAVAPDAVAREQQQQRVFALRSEIAQQSRVQDVGDGLLRAAVPLCGADVTSRVGITATALSRFKPDWRDAARALGFSDTVTIGHVAKGSAADRAGLRDRDRILSVNGRAISIGSDGTSDLQRDLAGLVRDEPIRITYRRDSLVATDSLIPDVSCAYDVQAVNSDELNAWADGKTVTVTSAMLRFVPNDDELATVVAHEIAHNAMHHLQAKKKNSILGALFGAAVDVASAAGGYNTYGAFTRSGADAGAQVFSQDFEREADYVGLYIMALGNWPIDSAPDLWRRVAAESPGSIKFASSHPTTAERFVRLEQWIDEIHKKQAAGEPLRPTLKH